MSTLDNLPVRESPEGVTFLVKVLPRARRDEIAGIEGEALKVRVNAPPVEGKANAALVNLVAKSLGVRRSEVEILLGERARLKTIHVRGVSASRLRDVLGNKGKR